MPTVLIVVEGGVVQSVSCTGGPVKVIVKDVDELKVGEKFDGEAFLADELSIRKFKAAVFEDVDTAPATKR